MRCGIGEILDAAAQEFGVEREALLARDRRPAVAAARQVAMYLARELTEHSLPEIGRGIGGRNHTTVLHAVNRVSAAIRSDDSMRERSTTCAAGWAVPRPDRCEWKNQQLPHRVIALPKPHRSGYQLLNTLQSPLSEIGSIF